MKKSYIILFCVFFPPWEKNKDLSNKFDQMTKFKRFAFIYPIQSTAFKKITVRE